MVGIVPNVVPQGKESPIIVHIFLLPLLERNQDTYRRPTSFEAAEEEIMLKLERQLFIFVFKVRNEAERIEVT